MERYESRLLAPGKGLGEVCSPKVGAVFRTLTTTPLTHTVLTATGNIVVQYASDRLRCISTSDPLPGEITALAADALRVYAAVGRRIALLHLSRQVKKWITIKGDNEDPVISIVPFGEVFVLIDSKGKLYVVDIDGVSRFEAFFGVLASPTAIVHPATYLNKVLIGTDQGVLRLVNIKSGKLVFEFPKSFGSAVTVLEQSPAVDVVAVGLRDGRIALHNIKFDKTIATFNQNSFVTAISFRTDGQETMISANSEGTVFVWNLNERTLIGQLPTAHRGSITALHCLHGEQLMVSSGGDNSLRTWIFDMGDGMPRQLVELEGHALPLSAVRFVDGERVLSAGLDGSVRSFSVIRDTHRQNFGFSGLISRAEAKRNKRATSTIQLDPVVEMSVSSSREAAWDDLLCRHRTTAICTTWSTRRQCLGSHRLVHKRFTTDARLTNAFASAICVSGCGNFAIVGYSSGHVDCFNMQSGAHRKTFSLSSEDDRAHHSDVCGLALDPLNKQLVTVSSDGYVRFWDFASAQIRSEMRTPSSVTLTRMSASSSLLAIGVGKGSLGVVDVLLKRLVRLVPDAHTEQITALEFSPDSKWLVSASNDSFLKIWDLVTSNLIDVMKCSSVCLGVSFSPGGEYIATCHSGQRAIFIWANKAVFGSNVRVVALPHDYVPPPPSASVDVSKEEDENFADSSAMETESETFSVIQVSDLVTLSGLAPPRWANLSNLDVIRERNKPIEPPRKPKSAPFFLPSSSTLTGFDFEIPEGNDDAHRKAIMAKRAMLEIDSLFAQNLLRAVTDEDYIEVFSSLKEMNISAVDFHIRALPRKAFRHFLSMLLIKLRTHMDFELVQSYLGAFVKIHREQLWATSDENEDEFAIEELLSELLAEQRTSFDSLDKLLNENAAIIQWIKSAVI